MIDRAAFAGQVEDALSRLHDKRYLAGHPLGRLLAVPGGALDADALQQVLLDAIRELRPQDAGPYHAADWRRFRHLVLRYVESVHPTVAANQLGVSPRQARRDHHEALEAVTTLLWASVGARGREATAPRHSTPGTPSDTSSSAPIEPADEPSEDVLDAELVRIGSAPPAGPLLLGQVLAGAIETVAHLAESRGVTIQSTLPANLRPVAASADALRHVLLSLLSASVDWDPESHVLVTAESPGEEVEVRLAVRRRVKGRRPGGGQPFLETDHAPSLRVAARLAEMQGGSLDVRETDEGDLIARLRLRAFRPATVLVVDDNPDFVRLFRRYLSGAPYRVLEAKLPGEAVRLAAEARADVITLDVMMPSQDGWQILQQLKRHPQTRSIPVVVCSVLRERALALSLGASGFLAKPITQQALLGCLARHFGTMPPAAPADSPSPLQPIDH